MPKNLQLERLIGQEFNFIGLGRFQIQFHISSLVAIHVEGRWELRDASGAVVDSDREHGERDAYRLHRIIDVPITRFRLDAPRSFTLFFETGHSLTIYDDSDQCESFSIHFTGECEFRDFDGTTSHLREELEIGTPEILSTESESLPATVETTMGQLILDFESIRFALDTGESIDYSTIERICDEYWDRVEGKE